MFLENLVGVQKKSAKGLTIANYRGEEEKETENL